MKCKCGRNATHNWAWAKYPTSCEFHAEGGMVGPDDARCTHPRCGRAATCGFPGEFPTSCRKHAREGEAFDPWCNIGCRPLRKVSVARTADALVDVSRRIEKSLVLDEREDDEKVRHEARKVFEEGAGALEEYDDEYTEEWFEETWKELCERTVRLMFD